MSGDLLLKPSPGKFNSRSNISSRLESLGFAQHSSGSSNKNFLIAAMNKIDRKKSSSSNMISTKRNNL